MPVQINEVIIRAVVDPRPSGASGGNGIQCPPGTSSTGESEIMEKILEIIKEKQER